MPGKSTLPLSANKSKERTGSSTSDSKKRRDDIQKISIWPEWTEAELAAEKWDIAGGKGKDKKTPLPGVLFEDPDGHVVLPSSLTAECWKRPSEYLLEQMPNMVITEDTVDLVTANEHLNNSETMLWIISQLTALWNVRVQLSAGMLGQTVAAISSANPSSMSGSDNNDASSSQYWKPWDHIYPQPKGQSLPMYNPAGKYCVRLHWMGHWRKVTVDDQLPFDAQGRLLLPSTTNSTELWPAILCKAILKVMSLDYAGGCEWSEYGESSPVEMLTGWLPHTITIRKDAVELWDKLSGWLPLWKRPDLTASKPPEVTTPTAPLHNKHLDAAAEGKPRSMEGKRHKGGSAHQLAVPANTGGATIPPVTSTEMTRAIVLASYSQPPEWYPIQQSVKQDLEVGSELLRDNGLPADLPHSVLLTQVRDEPLELPPKEPPPPVIQLPYYLGLRHRSKLPTDPPSPSPRPREPKWVKLNTPLLRKPTTPAAEEDNGEETGRQGSQPVITDPVDNNSSWISYEDFICSFNLLHVFYNPAVFSNREMYQDLRNTVANSAIPVSLSNKKGAAVSSIVISSSKILSGPTALVPVILCDSTESVDITICFSSLSNWLDGQRISRTKKLPTLGLVTPSVSSNEAGDNEGTSVGQRFREVLPAGVLLVEPYCWKDVVLRSPVLTLTTTAVQTAILSLPPGRHIFRLQIMAPLGYHLELLSDHYFILTNEDAVFVHMSDESKMMVLHSTRVIGNLLEMATTPVAMDIASPTPSLLQERVTKMVEVQVEDPETRKHLYEALYTAIHYALCSMQQQLQLTTVMLFAWRAFLHLMYHLVGGARQFNMDVSTLPPIVRKNPTVPDSWQDREVSSEELSAVTKLQREIRKYLTNKIMKCLETDSREHIGMMEQVSKSAELIAAHSEQLGKLVFSIVFQLDQELFKHFPYYENEEKNRAYHQDYSGSYNDLPLNHWCVLFRETFYVQDPGLVMLPRLMLPAKTSLLRVIDNDSGVEVARLFQKVVPHYYKPNKTGYTILGEVWSRNDVIDGGEWQLRLVGTSPRLPFRDQSMTTDDPNAAVTTAITITPSLNTQEIMDYYLPDKNNCFLRYLLKVKKNEACAVTIQLKTSKSEAFIKLQILDRGELVSSTKGKGYVVLPIYWLQPDPVTSAIAEDSEEDVGKGHKYVIEATIVRDSWPSNESAWSYINMLKNVEKLEDGHAGSDKPTSGRRQNKPPKGPKTGGRERAGSVMNNRLNNLIDVSKAHWIMRLVTPSADAVNCIKDTEKEDELKGMMDAWETQQPGRSKKALESRRKYLDQSKQQDEVQEHDQTDGSSPPSALVSDADNAIAFTSLPLPDGPAMVKRIDYTKYMM